MDRIEITSGGRSYVLDLSSEELFRGREERIPLTRQQWALLRYFVENNGRLIQKDELHGRHWANAAVTDEAISQAIRALRAALDDQHSRPLIQTVHGRGYRFAGDVKTVRSSPLAAERRGDEVAKTLPQHL